MINEEQLQESLNSIAEILNQPELKDYADSIYVQQIEGRFVLGVEEKKEEEPCIAITEQMLKDYPSFECKKHLHNLVLGLQIKFEKEYEKSLEE